MKRLLMHLLCCLSLTLSQYAMSAEEAPPLPPPFTAQYSVSIKGLPVGIGVRRFYPQGDHYIFETVTETSGLAALFRGDEVTERSVFQLKQGHVRPLRYEYHHVGRKKERHYKIEFDWETQRARNTIPDDQWEVPITENTLDNMVYQLVLMQQLASGKRELAFEIVYKGEVRHYQPTFLGEEIIETGVGRLTTLKYARDSEDGKRRTVLWCAPKFNFLPVKAEHIEKGDTGRLVLEQVEGL